MPAIFDPNAPLPHERLRGSGFGLVLLLIAIALGFQLGAPDTGFARLVTLVVQSVTLLAALHVSGIRPSIIRAVTALTVVACLSAAGILLGSGELGVLTTRAVGLMLVVIAPLAVFAGMVRHYRAAGGVTLTTMFAGLCIYLLIGMAFSYTYGIISSLSDESVFAQQIDADQSDYLYFSFTTMTTTGYGDLSPESDPARSVAITEQLFGQIYLVTVVALIVSNLGRQGTDRREQRPAPNRL